MKEVFYGDWCMEKDLGFSPARECLLGYIPICGPDVMGWRQWRVIRWTRRGREERTFDGRGWLRLPLGRDRGR